LNGSAFNLFPLTDCVTDFLAHSHGWLHHAISEILPQLHVIVIKRAGKETKTNAMMAVMETETANKSPVQ